MLETYIKAVNDPSAIPVMETSWQTSLRMLAERFHSEALDMYKKGMTAALEERGQEPLEAGGRMKYREIGEKYEVVTYSLGWFTGSKYL